MSQDQENTAWGQRQRRVQLNCPASLVQYRKFLFFEWDQQANVGTVLDVSLSGIRLKTSMILKKGDRVKLSFSLSMGSRHLQAKALTVRLIEVSQDSPHQFTYGLKFSELSKEDEKYLRSLISLQSAA